MLARIAVLTCAVVLLNHSEVLAQNEALLTGRYSFSAHGNRQTQGFTMMGDHVSREGTIRFDGNGTVTAVRFKETVDGDPLWFGGTGNATDVPYFVSGTYTVLGNGLGKIELHFQITVIASNQPHVVLLDEVWDISLANGGKSFFLDVDETMTTISGPLDQKVTIVGEARAF